MRCWWAALTMAAASSSRLQRVAGRSWSSVWLLARATTDRGVSGGNARRSATTGQVLQAVQAQNGEAFAPLADGVAVAVEFGGDDLVGGLVRGGAEDEPAAEGEGL